MSPNRKMRSNRFTGNRFAPHMPASIVLTASSTSPCMSSVPLSKESLLPPSVQSRTAYAPPKVAWHSKTRRHGANTLLTVDTPCVRQAGCIYFKTLCSAACRRATSRHSARYCPIPPTCKITLSCFAPTSLSILMCSADICPRPSSMNAFSVLS